MPTASQKGLLAFTLSFLASSCFQETPNNSSSGGSQSGNSNLSGIIVYRSLGDDVYQFNLKTGAFENYKVLNGDNDPMGVSPAAKQIYLMDDRFETGSGSIDFITDFRVHNRDGSLVEEFSIDGKYTINHDMKVHSDGSVIASHMTATGYTDDDTVVVFDSSGNLAYIYPTESSAGVTSYAWSTDNKLYVGEYDGDSGGDSPYSAIYVVDFNLQGQRSLVKYLPDIELYESMSIHPNNSTILFNASPARSDDDNGEVNLYKVESNGSNLRLFIDGDESMHGTYSPDGNHAIVSYEILSASVTAFCFDELFIVETEKDGLTLNREDTFDYAFSLNVEYAHLKTQFDDDYLFCAQSSTPPLWLNW